MTAEEMIYRAKGKITGEWLYGEKLTDQISGTAAIVTYVNLAGDVTDLSEINIYFVLPETLGRFTGLTDKNGREIFEGDIVSLSEYTCRGKVEWSCGLSGFFIEINHSHLELANYLVSHLEVVGNIYDNPELLKKQ